MQKRLKGHSHKAAAAEQRPDSAPPVMSQQQVRATGFSLTHMHGAGSLDALDLWVTLMHVRSSHLGVDIWTAGGGGRAAAAASPSSRHGDSDGS